MRFFYHIFGSIFFIVWIIIGLTFLWGGAKTKDTLKKISDSLPALIEALKQTKN